MIDEAKRDEIRESLVEQLVKSGTDIDVLMDMVDQIHGTLGDQPEADKGYPRQGSNVR
jgi:hypothetical protein